MFKVICQEWVESERGWGLRPDGYSLHLTEEDRQEFIKRYESRLPKNHVPDEYSFTAGPPFEAEVTEEVFNKVFDYKKNGVPGYWTPPRATVTTIEHKIISVPS